MRNESIVYEGEEVVPFLRGWLHKYSQTLASIEVEPLKVA